MKTYFGLIVTVFGAFLALYLTFIVDYEHISTRQAGYATLILFLGVFPSIVVLLARCEANIMPLMPLHGLFYAFTFGLPALSSKTRWFTDSAESMDSALILTILGLVCLYLGYYIFRGIFSKLQPIVFLFDVSISRQYWVALFLFGLFLLFNLFPGLANLPSVKQLSAPLQYVSIGMLFNLLLEKKLSKFNFIFVFIIIWYSLFINLVSGSLAQPIFLLIFLMIIYWNKKKRFSWSFILALLAIVVLLNPVKSSFRAEAWGPQFASYSYFDKALLFFKAAKVHYSGNNIANSIADDASTVNRLAHLAVFSYVIERTPTNVPYWYGESYNTLWTSFIPRIIFPNKPEEVIGQKFGHRYGLLQDDDTNTSFNLPWLPEFYSNFGVLGIIFGMFAVGVLFRYLVHKLSAPANHPFEYILGITVTFNLFYAESNFSLMVGGIFLTYLGFFLLLRLMMVKIK